MAPSPYVVPFSDVGAADRARVGGKAATLAELARRGFPVPEGWVVAAPLLEHALDVLGLADAARRARAGSEDDAAVVRRGLLEGPLDETVAHALRDVGARAGDALLAVRSSAIAEDLADASFAGQYESVLGVRGPPALEAAARRVWASAYSARVLSHGAGALGALALLVQRLVPAEVAGVLFTVDPTTGREREVLVEAAPGLGELVVSGRVDVDRWVVEADTGRVIRAHVGVKARRADARSAGGVAERDVDPEEAARPSLAPEVLGELVALGRRVQDTLRRPVDLEWAYSGGRLHLLQARPITRLSFAPELGEWSNADFRDGGVASDVCCAFMFSLYDRVNQAALPGYFREIGLLRGRDDQRWTRLLFGRPYWNMGAVKRLLAPVPGFDEASFEAGVGIAPQDGPRARTPVTLGALLRAAPLLWWVARSMRRRIALTAAVVRDFPARRAEVDLPPAALAALPDDALAARYADVLERFYFETEASYFATAYQASTAMSELRRSLSAIEARVQPSLIALVGGLRDVPHLAPAKAAHAIAGERVARGAPLDEAAVARMQREFGHHGRKVLDIRVPRFEDDPDFVRQVLAAAVESFDASRDPAAREAEQHRAYQVERARILRALRWRPWLRASFRRRLEVFRTAAWWREQMREVSTIAYAIVRRWSVEVARRLTRAGRLDAPEALWSLTQEEVLALLRGTLTAEEARARIAAADRYLNAFAEFAPPNEIGARYRFAAAPAAPRGPVLTGVACSGGRVSGVARVVRRIEDAQSLRAGDILVAQFTDPAWTPVFGRISAVVTETGGVLAHAAVIARELGLPAVLAVPGATRQIVDGSRIVVDGSRGTIELTMPAASGTKNVAIPAA